MGNRILLFDDDYESMQPLVEVLHEQGYEVVISAAQEIPRRLSQERFDLLIVDTMIHPYSPGKDDKSVVHNVHYPGVNWQATGEEFLRRLRCGEYEDSNGSGTRRTVPVVVLSATADSDKDYEAQAVFEKPFDLEEMIEKIRVLTRG
uniref:Response regulator transcription factor n=1 Tax=Caldilinea aerophila TaxID=133453 RepID=A0A7C1JG69_9CHLR